jgi:Na+-transporting NADH:ubiquinone oxidoreductase subunit NqrD
MYIQTYNMKLIMKDKPIKSGMLSICSVIYSTQEFDTSKIKMTINVITRIMEIIQNFLQRFISLGNDHL